MQSNIPILDPDAWSLKYLQQTLSELRSLSVRPKNATPESPGLIIWPESPAPFFVTDLHLRATLGELARETDSYIIAGSMGIEHAGDPNQPPDIFNSAALVAPSGEWIARYDKIHLVPFGEFIPFENLIAFAKPLTREIGTFARGRSRMPLDAGSMKSAPSSVMNPSFPTR